MVGFKTPQGLVYIRAAAPAADPGEKKEVNSWEPSYAAILPL